MTGGEECEIPASDEANCADLVRFGWILQPAGRQKRDYEGSQDS